MRRNFSKVKLNEVLRLIPTPDFTPWGITTPPRPPSDRLLTNLQLLDVFAITASEAGKVTLIDTILIEVLQDFPKLRAWKEETLMSDVLKGVADYVIAPRRGYMETPLLCVAEAKKDDFEAGRRQCVAEMLVCRQNNQQEGHEIDVYGIVSNGQSWTFYQLTPKNVLSESDTFALGTLPILLGVLALVLAACEKNIPPSITTS